MGTVLQDWNAPIESATKRYGDGNMDAQMLLLGEIVEHKGKNAGRKELRDLIARQQYKCALTGVELEPATAELDHIVPVVDGGDHSIGNLQVLHKIVNRMKGSMTNDEFIKWCELVANRTACPPYGFGSS
jgi:CRISPR/Cas system Type II protein with McrA/HNH and RuvC-like nuclease domain